MQKSWGKTNGGWPALTLEPLPEEFFSRMSYTGYSLLMESPHFWDMVLGDKVLVFEPDSWVCKNAAVKLEQWMKYDYVGAPWNHYVKGCPGGMGNGGFSLRSRGFMRELAANVNARRLDTMPLNNKGKLSVIAEDIFFCR